MHLALPGLIGTLALMSAQARQEVPAGEVTFHRVYLRNGNFIDGALVRQSNQDVVLKIVSGDITIRGDLIERTSTGGLRVEFMKLRSLSDKPAIVSPAARILPEGRRDPLERPRRVAPASEKAAPLPPGAPVEEAVKSQVDEALRRALSAKGDQRAEIVQEVVPLGAPAALYLASKFEQLPGELRGAVAETLSSMGERGVVPILRAGLTSADPGIRIHATLVIGSVGDARDAPNLQPMLRDPEPMARQSAIAALQRLGDPRSLRPVAALVTDPVGSVQSRAVDALLDLARKTEQEADIVPVLEDLLNRSKAQGRAQVIEALEKTGRPEAVPLVGRYLGDDSPLVRRQAALALAALNAPESAGAIASRLAVEQEEAVRLQLAQAAGKLKVREAIPALIEWLGGASPSMKEAAHRALREISGQNLSPSPEEWTQWWEKAK